MCNGDAAWLAALAPRPQRKVKPIQCRPLQQSVERGRQGSAVGASLRYVVRRNVRFELAVCPLEPRKRRLELLPCWTIFSGRVLVFDPGICIKGGKL